jgi:hypothetical protein
VGGEAPVTPVSTLDSSFLTFPTNRAITPPTRLHELDSNFSDDMMYILSHDIFVLDVSLFWFMMKHKGRYQGALLDWLCYP